MTQSICIVCRSYKFGAWTTCKQCCFRPRTIFDLAISITRIIESIGYQLQHLSSIVAKHDRDLEEGGTLQFDVSIFDRISTFIKEPSWRDVLSLRRAAKDGLSKKELNLHEVGPDGYRSLVLRRNRDIGAHAFDAIRSVRDGDAYAIVAYTSGGQRHQSFVGKDK